MSTVSPLYGVPGPSSQIHQYGQPAMPLHASQQPTGAVQRPYAQPLQPQPGSSGNIYLANGPMSQSLPAHMMPIVQTSAPITQSSHTLPVLSQNQAAALYSSHLPHTPISAVPTHAPLPQTHSGYPMQQQTPAPLQPVAHQMPAAQMHYQQVSQPMYPSVSAPSGYPAQPSVHARPLESPGLMSGMPMGNNPGMIGIDMGMAQDYRFGGLPGQHMRMQDHEAWQGEWDDADGYDQEVLYGNIEVKQRRRTTPEQLKVLEHWFDVNPKPDNALREWLAVELGMTKRNIQVWFQNRRAKVKGLALKEKQAAEKVAQDVQQTERPRVAPLELGATAHAPPTGIMTAILTASTSTLMPPTPNVDMGRRVSLASGEAMSIEAWAAKRAAAGKAIRVGGMDGPARSPTIGAASAARRSSIPYPAPSGLPGPMPLGALSPKASPSVRPMPSQLHLAAMRNNTRRASVPGLLGAGAAQLLSSGPFVPPRVISTSHPMPPPAIRTAALEPIKDHDHEASTGVDPNTPYDFVQTPFSDGFLSATGQMLPRASPTTYAPPDVAQAYDIGGAIPGLATGPLPSPSFSFGGPAVRQDMQPQLTDDEAARTQAFYMAIQQRGRMGSIASINTFTTEGATTEGESVGTSTEWLPPPADGRDSPSALVSQSRRASAPADLLEQIGFLGLTSANGLPLRPSPLGNVYVHDHSTPGASRTTVSPKDIEASKSSGPTSVGGLSSLSSTSASQFNFSQSGSSSAANTTPELADLQSPIKLAPPATGPAASNTAAVVVELSSGPASVSSGATPVNAPAGSKPSPYAHLSEHSDGSGHMATASGHVPLPSQAQPDADASNMPVIDWSQFGDGDDFSFFNDLTAELTKHSA